MQRETPIYEADKLLANIQLVIDRTDAAGTPVFYIQHSTDTPPKSQLNILRVGKVVVTGLVTTG